MDEVEVIVGREEARRLRTHIDGFRLHPAWDQERLSLMGTWKGELATYYYYMDPEAPAGFFDAVPANPMTRAIRRIQEIAR